MLKYFLILLILGGLEKVYSHPHAWIDMDTSIQFDGEGLVTGLRVGWLFDDFYSIYTLDGQKPTFEVLQALGIETLRNIRGYSYYTHIYVNNSPAEITEVSDYTSTFIDGRWRLEFLVSLHEKVDLAENEVYYQVYDPTYYVEILHKEGRKSISLEKQADISFNITSPKPPKNMILLAAALDFGQKTDEVLGKYFAETVTLSCP
ncbi:MAG: DUF1007 family protein [Bacteroidota bacterium]